MTKFLPSILALLLLINSATPLFGQSKQDSLVKFRELVFISDFEKQTFLRLYKTNDTPDLLALLLSSYPQATSTLHATTDSKINQTVTDLRGKLAGKTNTKAVKQLYATVHNTFLRKYELENNFGDIFSNGQYNCVSASALYGLVLHRLNIPFTIKETPNHVYLVAYPTSDNVVIESTDPTAGSVQLNETFKNAYLQHLLSAKLISKAEYDAADKTALFNKYYFSQEEDITLQKLAGLQYYNEGIYAASKEKYPEAYQYFAKAYLLHPSTRIRFLLQQMLSELAAQSKYTKPEDSQFLIQLTRFNTDTKEWIDRKNLLGEFGRITDAQLINNSNFTLYENTFTKIKQEIQDTALVKQIEFIYYYETSRISLNNGKTEGILPRLEKAYQLNPQNADVHSMLTNVIFKDAVKTADTRQILAMMEKNLKKYPFLEQNQNVTSVMSNCYLDIATQYFAKNNLTKGEENLVAFEKLVAQKSYSAEAQYVVRAYIEGASAYFRAGNKAKCKQVLNRGLKFAPENYMLTERLSQVR